MAPTPRPNGQPLDRLTYMGLCRFAVRIKRALDEATMYANGTPTKTARLWIQNQRRENDRLIRYLRRHGQRDPRLGVLLEDFGLAPRRTMTTTIGGTSHEARGS